VIVPDYYAVLGVTRDASDEDIIERHKLLTRVWHPDHNRRHDAEDRLKEINVARDVLLDPERRRQYDRELDARPVPTGTPGYDESDSPGSSETSADNIYEEPEEFSIRIKPRTIDFGDLGIGGSSAEAEIVVLWERGMPSSVDAQPRAVDWWQVSKWDLQDSFISYTLKAEAYDELAAGRHSSHINIIVDGVPHCVKLVMTVVSAPSERSPYSPDPDGYYPPPHTSPRTWKPPSSPPPTHDHADTRSPTAARKRRTISLWALVITGVALLVGIIVAVNVNQADQRAAQQRAAMVVCDKVFTVTDFVQVVMRPPSNTFYWGTPTYSANECEYELTWGPNLETDVQITVACGSDALSSWSQFKSQYGGTTTMIGFPQAIESTDSAEASALTPKVQFVEAYLQAVSNPDIQMNPLVSHEGAVLEAILRRAYNNELQRNVC
jgi:DnaJ domain